MKNNYKNQKLPIGRLVAAFVLATLANESLHFHEPHNPHGNRRERIEEIRARLLESRTQDRFSTRRMNSGGGGPAPEPASRSEAFGRRRIVTLNI